MSTASPCERTMVWLRELGYTVDKVERRLPRGFTTVDCFGFADILAIKADTPGVLAVQATTSSHFQDRVKKVQAEPRSEIWLAARNLIWVVGWALRAKTNRWEPRVMAASVVGWIELPSIIVEDR